jgi:fatty acid desaturase
MAKGKKKTGKPQKEASAAKDIKKQSLLKDLEKPGLYEYGLQVVLFILFCAVSYLLAYLVTGYTLGLNFFFGVLITGFIVVCVFSYIHDRLYQDEDEIETGP